MYQNDRSSRYKTFCHPISSSSFNKVEIIISKSIPYRNPWSGRHFHLKKVLEQSIYSLTTPNICYGYFTQETPRQIGPWFNCPFHHSKAKKSGSNRFGIVRYPLPIVRYYYGFFFNRFPDFFKINISIGLFLKFKSSRIVFHFKPEKIYFYFCPFSGSQVCRTQVALNSRKFPIYENFHLYNHFLLYSIFRCYQLSILRP